MKISRTHIIFGFLLVFVLSFCSWWFYLIHNKNKELYQAKYALITADSTAQTIDINSINLKADSIILSPQSEALVAEYKRENRMIVWEGIGFFLSLIIGIWIVFRSIRSEVALTKQQHNFLQSITHELKSPIASIRLVLETFQKRNLNKEQMDKFTGNALKDVERLQNLVDNVLLATKIENAYSWSLTDIDVIELTERILAKMRQKHPKVDFKSRYTANEIIVKADITAFTSLAVNLIENAVKYSPKGDAEIKVTIRKGVKNIDYEVSDNGIGIPLEEKQRIFDKFYRIGNEDTRKTKGTGLGLHIVKEIVKAHRGWIIVKDNSPVGTIFRVTVPMKLNRVND